MRTAPAYSPPVATALAATFISVIALTIGAATHMPAVSSYDPTIVAVEDWQQAHPPRPLTQPSSIPKIPTYAQYKARRAADHFFLAATMWGEARGEPNQTQAMLAVGNTILNRLNAPNTAQRSIAGVVLRSKQYSCWNPKDPNRLLLTRRHLGYLSPQSADGQAWALANELADGLISGRLGDTTHGATHYHATAVHPYWATATTRLFRLAHQVFYR